jgi:hypothetical protein
MEKLEGITIRKEHWGMENITEDLLLLKICYRVSGFVQQKNSKKNAIEKTHNQAPTPNPLLTHKV